MSSSTAAGAALNARRPSATDSVPQGWAQYQQGTAAVCHGMGPRPRPVATSLQQRFTVSYLQPQMGTFGQAVTAGVSPVSFMILHTPPAPRAPIHQRSAAMAFLRPAVAPRAVSNIALPAAVPGSPTFGLLQAGCPAGSLTLRVLQPAAGGANTVALPQVGSTHLQVGAAFWLPASQRTANGPSLPIILLPTGPAATPAAPPQPAAATVASGQSTAAAPEETALPPGGAPAAPSPASAPWGHLATNAPDALQAEPDVEVPTSQPTQRLTSMVLSGIYKRISNRQGVPHHRPDQHPPEQGAQAQSVLQDPEAMAAAIMVAIARLSRSNAQLRNSIAKQKACSRRRRPLEVMDSLLEGAYTEDDGEEHPRIDEVENGGERPQVARQHMEVSQSGSSSSSSGRVPAPLDVSPSPSEAPLSIAEIFPDVRPFNPPLEINSSSPAEASEVQGPVAPISPKVLLPSRVLSPHSGLGDVSTPSRGHRSHHHLSSAPQDVALSSSPRLPTVPGLERLQASPQAPAAASFRPRRAEPGAATSTGCLGPCFTFLVGLFRQT